MACTRVVGDADELAPRSSLPGRVRVKVRVFGDHETPGGIVVLYKITRHPFAEPEVEHCGRLLARTLVSDLDSAYPALVCAVFAVRVRCYTRRRKKQHNQRQRVH